MKLITQRVKLYIYLLINKTGDVRIAAGSWELPVCACLLQWTRLGLRLSLIVAKLCNKEFKEPLSFAGSRHIISESNAFNGKETLDLLLLLSTDFINNIFKLQKIYVKYDKIYNIWNIIIID